MIISYNTEVPRCEYFCNEPNRKGFLKSDCDADMQGDQPSGTTTDCGWNVQDALFVVFTPVIAVCYTDC